MAVNFLTSEKGKRKLVENSFVYALNKRGSDDKLIWVCEKYKTNEKSCNARVHTVDDRIVYRFAEHTHAAEKSNVELKEIMNRTKERAVATQEGTGNIIIFAKARASEAALGNIRDGNIRRSIQRARVAIEAAPANPNNLIDIVIPNNYKQYEAAPGNIQNFLLHDSGPGPDRILLFGTERNLQFLEAANEWQADGTFRIAPPLFEQLYTIHGNRFNSVQPAVYALLPNKQRHTYDRMIQAIKNLNPRLNPTSILTDFENGAIQAFAANFPQAQHTGCYFHFCQAIYRKIQNSGLALMYSADADFALKARYLPALAFVPPADVVMRFEEITDDQTGILPPELQPVVDYFEDTWIGRPNRRGNGRRNPLFNINTWNQHARVINRMARTNNAVEGFHSSINTLLGMAHPTIWKLIKGFIKVQKKTDGEIENLVAGHLPRPQKKRYRDVTLRLERIVEDYDNRNTEEYLRGIAHNLTF